MEEKKLPQHHTAENLDAAFNSLWLDEDKGPRIIEKIEYKQLPEPEPIVVTRTITREAPKAKTIINETIVEEGKEETTEINRKTIKSKPKVIVPKIKSVSVKKEPVSDIDVFQKFKDFESMTKMVIAGIRNSLFCTGGSGVGKSALIMQTLNSMGKIEGKDWLLAKGSSTPAALYRVLFEYRTENSIVVLDDIDKIWGSDDSVNVLKGALDSQSKSRRVSWLSSTNYNPKDKTEEEKDELLKKGKFPSYFDYSGKLFAISNLKFEDVPEAIKTRCLCIDLNLTQKEVVEYMWSKLPEVKPELDMELKKDTMQKLVDHYSNSNKSLNFRTLITALEFRINNVDDWLNITSRYG